MSEILWRILAAALGVTVGGAAGVAIGRRMGKEERDDLTKEMVKLKLDHEMRLKKCVKQAKDPAQLLIAMTAVGIAVAGADGEIADSERDEIERFVAGVLASAFPQGVKDVIEGLYEDPPQFHKALKDYVCPIVTEPYFDWALINDVVEIVTYADGIAHPSESALRSVLAQFREQCDGRETGTGGAGN